MKYLVEQSLMWMSLAALLGFFVGFFLHVVYCHQKKTLLKSSILAARDKTQQERTKVKELEDSNQTLERQIKIIQLKNEAINKEIEIQKDRRINVNQPNDTETKTSEQIAQLKTLNQQLEKQLKAVQLENEKINQENKRQKEKLIQATNKNTTEDKQAPKETIQDRGTQPKQLTNVKDQADDLQKIKGIGPVIEQSLHGIGIYTYQQIADFNEENILWVDTYLAFSGRIKRDKWIEQCADLVKS